MTITLLPHQTQGVRFLRSLEPPFKTNIQGAILADEMGLGKTIQIISLIDSSPLNITLVICPSTLQTMWVNQFNKFCPHINVYVFAAKNSLASIMKKSNQEGNSKIVIITTYGLSFRRSELFEYQFDRIVCDEAHYFRNPRSKTYQALMKLKSTTKVLLTGTPIQNRIRDIITLINFIIGKEQPLTLHFIKLFIKERMLRRKISDVGIELPPLEIQHIIVQGAAEHQTLVKSTQSFPYEYQIEKMIRAKQAAVFPQSLNSSFIKHYQLPQFNVDNFKSIHIVDNIILRKQPCIIFAEYTNEIAFIKTLLVQKDPNLNIKVINGSVSFSERNLISHDISIDVLIIQIAAGGTGLNLQHFSEVHFTSIQWNPAQTQQAIGRIKRIGQKNKMKVFIYIFKNSFEHHIQRVQHTKHTLIQQIIQ
jgi:SNF2 family DNA or RNA helicase